MRIYALAKELNLDSKDLVDICRKAGISGKGSALASLNDDEVEKVKTFFAGGKKGSTAKRADAGRADAKKAGSGPDLDQPYTRDSYIAPARGGKIRVLAGSSKKSAPPAEETPAQQDAPEEPEAEEALPPETAASTAPVTAPAASDVAVATTPEAAESDEAQQAESDEAQQANDGSVAGTEPPAESKPAKRAPVSRKKKAAPGVPERLEPEPMRRPPQEPSRKILKEPTRETKKDGPGRGKKAPPKKRREPVIRLAKVPKSGKSAARPKKHEVKAQKPDIRLPADAIRAHKAGQEAPLDKLAASAAKARKTEDRDKKKPPKAAAGGTGSRAGARPGAETPLQDKGGSKRRKGGAAEGGERSGRGLAGMASARADRQKARRGRSSPRGTGRRDDRDTGRRRPRTLTRRRNVNTAAPRKDKAVLELPCTVRSFSEATGVGSGQVLRALMGMGVTALNINAQLDGEVAELLLTELEVEVEFRQPASLEETLLEGFQQTEDDPESLVPRAPVITFLGHVDHGKTSLLDSIIGTNVVAGEAGGITQHIRAYQINKDGNTIAFVDTPGHEAFTEMRARGANVTDIAVVVIAADDGVMPQTEEAISHAKAAGVPIVVALNKMDLPGANADRVLQQLAAMELLPSEWGGDTEVVRTSATTGDGIAELLETILVTAELHEYQANPNRDAMGVCLEAEQESGRGVMAKLIVQNGTLRVGDVLLCGTSYGRVKAMHDTLKGKRRIKAAGPSMPVNVSGFDQAPEAGQRFYVVKDISQARSVAEQRSGRTRQQSLAGVTTRVSLEEFQRRLEEGNLADAQEVVNLNLIIRADVRGSIEAIEKELTKLDHPEIQIRILHKAVGAISAGDVMLAHASGAVIVGFNVIPDEAARSLADEKRVEIRRYDVIYKITDDVKATLEGKLKPDKKVVELGRAIVKQVFPISRVGAVAGCYVVNGSIRRGCRIRINRDSRTIGDYPLDSLRREKDDIKEVPRGMECGIKLAGFNDIKQDDVLEAYMIEEVARTL